MKVLILMQPILIHNCRKFHVEIFSNFGEIAIFVGGHFLSGFSTMFHAIIDSEKVVKFVSI